MKLTAQSWLSIELSPVVHAGKTGELLAVPANLGLRLQDCEKFAKTNNLEVVEMCSCPLSSKYLFYSQRAVRRVLEGEVGNFLRSELGYSAICHQSFVKELQANWHSAPKIPHEIGFILGYPAKDVFGFLGASTEPCTGCCGWQVFGNLVESQAVSAQYQRAKHLARAAIAA